MVAFRNAVYRFHLSGIFNIAKMDVKVWLLIILCSLLFGVFAKEPSVSMKIKSKLIDIQDGEDVHLNCTTTDFLQNFTVGFRKDEVNIESVSYMEHRFTTGALTSPDGRPAVQHVQIHDFNSSTDTGYYECYAETTSGNIIASDTIYLSVLHFPDSLLCSPSGPVNVTQNTPITVNCTADRGFPIATLQTNTTSPNNESWMLSETAGKLVNSLDLILNTSDNGVSYQCIITSSQYFPNMTKHCIIGPISVLPPSAFEIPPSTPLYTSTATQESTSSTSSIMTSQLPLITQPSVAVSVIVTLIVTVLLIIVILFILHRCGYWKWKRGKKGRQEIESEDDNTGINSTEQQSQDNLVLIDDMIDPMYQELPSPHTLPTSQIPRSVASQDSTPNNEIIPENNIPQLVRPRMELPSTSGVQPPHERALDSVNDVTYARPIKTAKSSNVNDNTDSLKNKHRDFSHLYAKIRRKASRKKQSRDTIGDADSSASAHWTLSFVETSSSHQNTPSAECIDCYIAATGLIFHLGEDETISPKDESPYAEVSYV